MGHLVTPPGVAADSRAGFTFTEAILATVFGSLVLILVFSILQVQTRSYSLLEDEVDGREILRTTAGFVADEVSPVARAGAIVAEPDSFVFRQPMVLGLVCATGSSTSYLHVPLAEEKLDTSQIAGYGERADDGAWTYTEWSWSEGGASYSSAAADACASAGADTVGASDRFVSVDESFTVGTVLMVYREVALVYRASSLDDGSYALFRRVAGGEAEEIGSGLDSTSHFLYHRKDTDSYETEVSSSYVEWVDKIRLVLELVEDEDDSYSGSLDVSLAFGNAQF